MFTHHALLKCDRLLHLFGSLPIAFGYNKDGVIECTRQIRVVLYAKEPGYMEVPAGMTAPLGTTTTPSRM